ncbi:tol-pal system YbgF family protein [Candidatus Neomarinimicrobiota bacterium]
MPKTSLIIPVYISLLLGLPLTAQEEIDTTDGHSNAYIQEDWTYFAERTRNEFLALGEKKYRRREFKSAIIDYFNFIYHFPEDDLVPLVHYRIGRSYELLREFDLARKEYEEVENDPKAEARVKIVCMRQLARLDYEQGLYDSVLVLPPVEDPYLLVLKGFASLTFENWSDSEQYFRRAQKFYPPQAQALLDSIIADLEAIPELDYFRTWKRSFVGLLPGGGHYYLGAKGGSLWLWYCCGYDGTHGLAVG